MIETSLRYTPYEEAVEYMGLGGEPGTLHDFFDQVMALNVEFGAADAPLDAEAEIDNSVITDLFADAER